eukprot:2272841-Pyramimonas_sp.AAC.1
MVSAGSSKPSPIRGAITANTASHGPLLDMLSVHGFDNYLVIVQEHHARGDRFAELQSKAAAKGFRGVWAEAIDTGRGGSGGGVAVIAPVHVLASAPPQRIDRVL